MTARCERTARQCCERWRFRVQPDNGSGALRRDARALSANDDKVVVTLKMERLRVVGV